jgi:hypothetical protein
MSFAKIVFEGEDDLYDIDFVDPMPEPKKEVSSASTLTLSEPRRRAQTPKVQSRLASKKLEIGYVLGEIEKEVLSSIATERPASSSSREERSGASTPEETFTIFGRVKCVVVKKGDASLRCIQLDVRQDPSLDDILKGFAKVLSVSHDDIRLYEIVHEDQQSLEGDIELESGRFGRLVTEERVRRGITNGAFFEVQRLDKKAFSQK